MRTRSRAAADDAERPRGGSASPGPGRSLAHLDADVLGVVASFGYLNELLLLRGTCRVCRDAAQRAMKGSCRRRGARYEKPVGEWYELRVDDGPHAISARTRVLGHCVGGLSIEADRYDSDLDSATVAAIGSFINSAAAGDLETLSIGVSVPKATLLDWIRRTPSLLGLSTNVLTDGDFQDSDFIAISTACPMLTRFKINAEDHTSAAEAYSYFFPNLESLDLSNTYGHHDGYRPMNFAKIARTLDACTSISMLDLENCHVEPGLVDLLLGSRLADRLTKLGLDKAFSVTPNLVLRCARAMPRLHSLSLPTRFTGDPAFYTALVEARPGLTELRIMSTVLTEPSIVAVSSLCLKKLDLFWFGNMTSPIGDIILSSRSAASLTDFTLHSFCSPGIVTAADMLRLVRGCPNLANFTWSEEDVRPLDASSTTALTALLRSRGGRPWIYPKEGGSLADDGSGIIYATAVRH